MKTIKLLLDKTLTLEDTRSNNRYSKASYILGILGYEQLNLEKNKIKPDFEGLNIADIFSHLKEEIKELEDELLTQKMSGLIQKSSIDYEKSLTELGDCAAMLIGILSWIMHSKNKENHESNTNVSGLSN